jgi:aspartate-semialdehyde dehydrogenase
MIRVGIVGATGEVGRAMISVLEKSGIECELSLLASERSVGLKLKVWGKDHTVQLLSEENLKGHDYLLFSAGSAISKIYGPIAAKLGITVIDNSSAFRKMDDIPLVVPEINGDLLKGYKGIIANPNCSTIQMVLALNLVQKELGIKEIVVSTYQSVSGAGNKGCEELRSQLDQEMSPELIKCFPAQIAHNVVPLIGEPEANGFTEEELKMHNETRKIFRDESITVYPTAVRVPVFYGHSESVYLETRKSATLEEFTKCLEKAENVTVVPRLVTPLDCQGRDETFVSRIRKVGDNRFMLWVVADNVRVGAATNAVRILAKILSF